MTRHCDKTTEKRVWHPKSLVAGVVGLFLGLSAVGCSGFNSPVMAVTHDGQYLDHQVGPGLVADPKSEIEDVPRPIGFTGVPSVSRINSVGVSARDLVYVYQGRAQISEVITFYSQQLWRFGWKRGVDTTEQGANVLTFSKGAELLKIFVSRNRGVATVSVEITPIGM